MSREIENARVASRERRLGHIDREAYRLAFMEAWKTLSKIR